MTLEEEMIRFQREELFKHNALRNCKQKLAVTVKTTSVPNQAFGDEYIPIEHVLGANKKKNRLLNPYVLRLRRKLPFQSYKLHRIDTVTGIIWQSFDKKRMAFNESVKKLGSRVQSFTGQGDRPRAASRWLARVRSLPAHCRRSENQFFMERDWKVPIKETQERNIDVVDKNIKNDMVVLEIDQSKPYNINFDWTNNSKEINTEKYFNEISEDSIIEHGNTTNEEYELALYKIGDPDLWYSAHVQLYEKMTSPEGKILWNDLTKHAIASVSTKNPNWSNQDVNIQYKSIELLARDDFDLPTESLCLIVPLKSAKFGDFIIVPSDDIITLNDQKDINKRNDNTFGSGGKSAIEDSRQFHPRVAIRTTRALFGGNYNNFKIITRGSDQFLKLPHSKPHRAQIDVEVRADDNELILVGIQGRLPTIVSDSTRMALVNDNDEAVAVRDVKIKRDDRCFCVWHCDCVCLSEDPNLLCRPLSDAQLIAAGLSTQEKSHHIRSVCYKDVMTLNLFVICVGLWGLDLLLQTPRKLDRYYENYLKCRTVVYDNEGWPIHPDTKQRSVRLISKPMEFILNLIFFITLPCLLICDALKKVVSCCNAAEQKIDGKYRHRDTEKCFSSCDVQGLVPNSRHRHKDLHRWMSPQAEELSTGIWQKGLNLQGKDTSNCLQPLLRKEKYCGKHTDQISCLDSEHDETEYILMQMQKSKESVEI
ncbi:uncharacterized protein LOC126774897 [Nymphalis io]|uniref:uncharacterized protein LOC126774897 n=1 Tax=Inachis io TaxID=171585 RepID=UPI00216A76E3|nr:uncharacterized protein LOC126774897 [Nymphalis io]